MEVSMGVAEPNNAAANTENMTNNNDNTNEEHETIEDNINEAASEDSGMSSVDNNNVTGKPYILDTKSFFCIKLLFRK